ncbi:MAG TPA: type II toxin-antitoxin system RelB/DinJ family antitoxin [Candidatus Acidoferrales bacterium]|nr:type II toxin-antitoxin system RelB/DinJ family antitoxin [Candidatus Acidoferrales bacterium]
MNTTSLHIELEPSVKKQAQKTADELGLSLNAVIKVLLKQFIRTKDLTVNNSEIPNEYLIKSLKQSDKDIKAGKTTSFKNTKDALSYIDTLIKDESRSTKRKD